MEEIKLEKADKKSSIGPFVVLLQLIIVAGIAGLSWHVNKKSNETSRSLNDINQSIASLESRVNAQIEKLNNPNPNEILSGYKLYSVIFPDGWGEITRTTDSDLMLIKGDKQPVKKAGAAPIVKDVSGDALLDPYVFAIQFFGNLVKPEGATVSNFTVGTESEKITGKKYVYTYTADANGRKKGDIDYQYRLPVKNGDSQGELVIFYKVYGVDAKDQVNVVDDIVRSIILKR